MFWILSFDRLYAVQHTIHCMLIENKAVSLLTAMLSKKNEETQNYSYFLNLTMLIENKYWHTKVTFILAWIFSSLGVNDKW